MRKDSRHPQQDITPLSQAPGRSACHAEHLLLDDAIPGHYLYHRSTVGEFSLSSDAVIPTFRWHKRIQTLISEEELKAFDAAGYNRGGVLLSFPGNWIDGKWTINQARGGTGRIGDRIPFDVGVHPALLQQRQVVH